jgi:hypothetical protein
MLCGIFASWSVDGIRDYISSILYITWSSLLGCGGRVEPEVEFVSEQNELFLVFFFYYFFSNIVKGLKRMHRCRKNKKN